MTVSAPLLTARATLHPQAVWDEFVRQGKLRRAGQRYMNCRTNGEPPHSKEARPSKILAPRQQRTIPCRRIRALPDLGGYNAVNLVLRRRFVRDILVQVVFKQGETDMGDKGKKDKGKREQQKTAQRTPEEKRRLKKEKKEEKKKNR